MHRCLCLCEISLVLRHWPAGAMTHSDFASCVRESCMKSLVQACSDYPTHFYVSCAFMRWRSDIKLAAIYIYCEQHILCLYFDPALWLADGCLQSSLFLSQDPACSYWRCSWSLTKTKFFAWIWIIWSILFIRIITEHLVMEELICHTS